MTTTQQTLIETILNEQFQPTHLQVINESHQHQVPPNSETHFKIVLVSSHFEKISRIQRHRAVYDALAKPLQAGVHALALHLYAPLEWQNLSEKFPDSPRCQGHSK